MYKVASYVYLKHNYTSIQRQVLEHRIFKQVYGDTIKNYAMYRVTSCVYLKLFCVFIQRHVLQDIILKQVYGDTIITLRHVHSRILCLPEINLELYTSPSSTTQNSQAGVQEHTRELRHVAHRILPLLETNAATRRDMPQRRGEARCNSAARCDATAAMITTNRIVE